MPLAGRLKFFEFEFEYPPRATTIKLIRALHSLGHTRYSHLLHQPCRTPTRLGHSRDTHLAKPVTLHSVTPVTLTRLHRLGQTSYTHSVTPVTLTRLHRLGQTSYTHSVTPVTFTRLLQLHSSGHSHYTRTTFALTCYIQCIHPVKRSTTRL